MNTLKVGLLLPSRDTAMTGAHDAAGLLDFARRAEAAGFDSVWTGDSPVARVRVEPIALLSAVASVTSSVALGTATFIGALRAPILAAHSISTLDQLSRGRAIIGVGAGFPMPDTEAEFAAVGVPFRSRVRRLDESVDAWRATWADPGRLLPAAQPSGPPVWLASGDTPAVIERVAQRYDGWLPYLPDPGAYARAWSAISTRAGELGRSVTPGLYATVNVGGEPAGLEDYSLAYYGLPIEVIGQLQAFVSGSVDDCAEQLGRHVDGGARHLVLRIGSLDPLAQLDAVAALANRLR